MNTMKCPKCNLDVMSEEIAEHMCKEPLSIRIEDETGIVMAYDGDRWYPYTRIAPDTQHEEDRDRSPDYAPEPYSADGAEFIRRNFDFSGFGACYRYFLLAYIAVLWQVCQFHCVLYIFWNCGQEFYLNER